MAQRSTTSGNEARRGSNAVERTPPDASPSRPVAETTDDSLAHDAPAPTTNTPALANGASSQQPTTPEPTTTHAATAPAVPPSPTRVVPQTNTAPTVPHRVPTRPRHLPGPAPARNATRPAAAVATPAAGPHAPRRVVLGDITPAVVPGGSSIMADDGAAPAPMGRDDVDVPVRAEEGQRNEFQVWVDALDDDQQAAGSTPPTEDEQPVVRHDVDEGISLSVASVSNSTEMDTAAPAPEPASTTNDSDDLASEDGEDGEADEDDEVDETDEDEADKENDAAAAAYPRCLHPYREVHGLAPAPPPAPAFVAPPPPPAPAPAPVPRTRPFPSLSTVTRPHHTPLRTPPAHWLPATSPLPGVLSAAAAAIDALIAAGARPTPNQLRMRAEDAELRALFEKERRRRGGAGAVSPVGSDDEGYDSDEEGDGWEVSDLEGSQGSSSEEDSSDEDWSEESSEEESNDESSDESSEEDDGEPEEVHAAPASPGKRKRELEEDEGKRTKAHW